MVASQMQSKRSTRGLPRGPILPIMVPKKMENTTIPRTFMPSIFLTSGSYTFSAEEKIKTINMGLHMIIEPRHGVSNNVVCTTSKASDQPTHMRSLIRAFSSRLIIL